MELDYRVNDGDGSVVEDKGGYGIGFTLASMDNLTIAVAHDSQENGGTAGTAAVTTARTKTEVRTELTAAGITTDNSATEATLNKLAALLGIAPTVAVADADDTEHTGIAIKCDFGVVKVTAGIEQMEKGDAEVDKQVLLLSGAITEKTSWLLGSSKTENQKDEETASTIWGLYHSMGGGVTLGYEARSNDNDGADDGGDQHNLFMRVNF